METKPSPPPTCFKVIDWDASTRCNLSPDHAGQCALAETLHVFTMQGGPDTVVAHSPEDAWVVLFEWTGTRPDDVTEVDGWRQLDDDHALTIVDDDDGKETRPCREWARGGRSFLCSTER